MRSKYKIYDTNNIYYLTSSIVQFIPIFVDSNVFNIMIESLNFYRINKNMRIYAYVIMDNHFHLIAQSDSLSNDMKNIKRFTAREIINYLELKQKSWALNQFSYWKKQHKKDSNYQIWQEGFHPQQIISDEMMTQKIIYIHNNPVKRGLVSKAEDWIYSSARNYEGLDGVMDIDVF